MKLVVISPEDEDSRELAVLDALFRAGLERYHVRKPRWSEARLTDWLRAVPEPWRERLVLHQCHGLVDTWGLGGRHWPEAAAPECPPAGRGMTSRACHDLDGLTNALGVYDALLVSPMWHSLSKPGRNPRERFSPAIVGEVLRGRSSEGRRTNVFALGGVTAEAIAVCANRGFDGVAVLGAIWQTADPVGAFGHLQSAAFHHAA